MGKKVLFKLTFTQTLRNSTIAHVLQKVPKCGGCEYNIAVIHNALTVDRMLTEINKYIIKVLS